mmetsp:Transcript_44879/g.138455  ORF Transcript_44879/g.138455 Transcript_44879/m.138455 type:complete len:448 (-) Transcript_44879:250-1593(-)
MACKMRRLARRIPSFVIIGVDVADVVSIVGVTVGAIRIPHYRPWAWRDRLRPGVDPGVGVVVVQSRPQDANAAIRARRRDARAVWMPSNVAHDLGVARVAREGHLLRDDIKNSDAAVDRAASDEAPAGRVERGEAGAQQRVVHLVPGQGQARVVAAGVDVGDVERRPRPVVVDAKGEVRLLPRRAHLGHFVRRHPKVEHLDRLVFAVAADIAVVAAGVERRDSVGVPEARGAALGAQVRYHDNAVVAARGVDAARLGDGAHGVAVERVVVRARADLLRLEVGGEDHPPRRPRDDRVAHERAREDAHARVVCKAVRVERVRLPRARQVPVLRRAKDDDGRRPAAPDHVPSGAMPAHVEQGPPEVPAVVLREHLEPFGEALGGSDDDAGVLQTHRKHPSARIVPHRHGANTSARNCLRRPRQRRRRRCRPERRRGGRHFEPLPRCGVVC